MASIRLDEGNSSDVIDSLASMIEKQAIEDPGAIRQLAESIVQQMKLSGNSKAEPAKNPAGQS